MHQLSKTGDMYFKRDKTGSRQTLSCRYKKTSTEIYDNFASQSLFKPTLTSGKTRNYSNILISTGNGAIFGFSVICVLPLNVINSLYSYQLVSRVSYILTQNKGSITECSIHMKPKVHFHCNVICYQNSIENNNIKQYTVFHILNMYYLFKKYTFGLYTLE